MRAALQTKTSSSASPTFTPVRSGLLRRKCACGGTPGPTGECDSCRKKKVQRHSENLDPSAIIHPRSSVSEVPPIVHGVVRSPGQRLDPTTRALMENRFGHDFGQVRIHTGAQASEAARSLDAHAFATGSQVVFGQGKFSPETRWGSRLLAHELSHVVQQETSGLTAGARVQRKGFKNPDKGEGEKLAVEEEIGEDTGETAREALGDGINIVLRKLGRVNCIPPNWKQLLRKTPDPSKGKLITGPNVRQRNVIGTLIPTTGVDRPPSYSFQVAENVVGTQSNENIIGVLQFDDLIFVDGIGGKDNEWYRVTTGTGLQGWVPIASVSLNPPEPDAHLHRVLGGETPLGLVATWYEPRDGFGKGEEDSEPGDARFYVAALAFANKGRAGMPSSTDLASTSAWKETALIEGAHIWMPSKPFLDSLKGVVSSGSITGEIWEGAKQGATIVAEAAVALVAFVAGVIYGALESVYDLFAGVVDLVKMIWDVLRSLFTGNIVTDAQALWEQLKSLPQLILQMGEEFDRKWNSSDLWDSGFFRGRVCGYIIAEALIAYFSVGIATAIKWTGKFAKIGRIIAKLPKISEAIKTVKNKISKKTSAWLKNKLASKTKKVEIDVPSTAREHVFAGDADGGYHSTARGPNPNIRVLKVRHPPDGNGVYKVKIEIRDPKTGEVIATKDSTMFPDSWPEEKILDETQAVMKANPPGAPNAEGVSVVQGTSPSGVPIKIVFKDGALQTFYPVHAKDIR